jgi:hypothetical protein
LALANTVIMTTNNTGTRRLWRWLFAFCPTLSSSCAAIIRRGSCMTALRTEQAGGRQVPSGNQTPRQCNQPRSLLLVHKRCGEQFTRPQWPIRNNLNLRTVEMSKHIQNSVIL